MQVSALSCWGRRRWRLAPLCKEFTTGHRRQTYKPENYDGYDWAFVEWCAECWEGLQDDIGGAGQEAFLEEMPLDPGLEG